jgi:hypothetical protein
VDDGCGEQNIMALIVGFSELTKKQKKKLKEALELINFIQQTSKIQAELRKEASEKEKAKKKNNHGGD